MKTDKEKLNEIRNVAVKEAMKAILEALDNVGKTKDYKDGYDEALEHFNVIVGLLSKFNAEDNHEEN